MAKDFLSLTGECEELATRLWKEISGKRQSNSGRFFKRKTFDNAFLVSEGIHWIKKEWDGGKLNTEESRERLGDLLEMNLIRLVDANNLNNNEALVTIDDYIVKANSCDKSPHKNQTTPVKGASSILRSSGAIFGSREFNKSSSGDSSSPKKNAASSQRDNVEFDEEFYEDDNSEMDFASFLRSGQPILLQSSPSSPQLTTPPPSSTLGSSRISLANSPSVEREKERTLLQNNDKKIAAATNPGTSPAHQKEAPSDDVNPKSKITMSSRTASLPVLMTDRKEKKRRGTKKKSLTPSESENHRDDEVEMDFASFLRTKAPPSVSTSSPPTTPESRRKNKAHSNKKKTTSTKLQTVSSSEDDDAELDLNDFLPSGPPPLEQFQDNRQTKKVMKKTPIPILATLSSDEDLELDVHTFLRSASPPTSARERKNKKEKSEKKEHDKGKSTTILESDSDAEMDLTAFLRSGLTPTAPEVNKEKKTKTKKQTITTPSRGEIEGEDGGMDLTAFLRSTPPPPPAIETTKKDKTKKKVMIREHTIIAEEDDGEMDLTAFLRSGPPPQASPKKEKLPKWKQKRVTDQDAEEEDNVEEDEAEMDISEFLRIKPPVTLRNRKKPRTTDDAVFCLVELLKSQQESEPEEVKVKNKIIGFLESLRRSSAEAKKPPTPIPTATLSSEESEEMDIYDFLGSPPLDPALTATRTLAPASGQTPASVPHLLEKISLQNSPSTAENSLDCFEFLRAESPPPPSSSLGFLEFMRTQSPPPTSKETAEDSPLDFFEFMRTQAPPPSPSSSFKVEVDKNKSRVTGLLDFLKEQLPQQKKEPTSPTLKSTRSLTNREGEQNSGMEAEDSEMDISEFLRSQPPPGIVKSLLLLQRNGLSYSQQTEPPASLLVELIDVLEFLNSTPVTSSSEGAADPNHHTSSSVHLFLDLLDCLRGVPSKRGTGGLKMARGRADRLRRQLQVMGSKHLRRLKESYSLIGSDPTEDDSNEEPREDEPGHHNLRTLKRELAADGDESRDDELSEAEVASIVQKLNEVDEQTSTTAETTRSIFTLLMTRTKLYELGAFQTEEEGDDVILRLAKRELQEDMYLEEALGSSKGVDETEAKKILSILLNRNLSVPEKVRELSCSDIGVSLLQVFLDAAALVSDLESNADINFLEFIPWRDFLRKASIQSKLSLPHLPSLQPPSLQDSNRESHNVCRDRTGRKAILFLELLNVTSDASDHSSLKSPSTRVIKFEPSRTCCGSGTIVLSADLNSLVRWLLWLLPPTCITIKEAGPTSACQCQRTDWQVLSKFILVYSAFCGASELYGVLIDIYDNEESQRPKVIRFIREWTEKNPAEVLFEPLNKFVKNLCSEYPEEHQVLSPLLHKLDRHSNKTGNSQNGCNTPSIPTTPPNPTRAISFKKSSSVRSLLSSPRPPMNAQPLPGGLNSRIKVEEIAQQLLYFQWSMLKMINLREFDDLAWTKGAKRSPNIYNFIEHFNKLVFWMATRIVTEEDTKRRAKMIQKFIGLGKRSLELKNYNVVMAVVAGLNHCSVLRLKDAWNSLSAKTKATFAELETLMEARQNYKSYRQVIHRDREEYHSAIVPYLGIYLRDLVFLEEGNPSFVPAEESLEETESDELTTSKLQKTMLINCYKIEMSGGVYEEVWHLQSLECSVKPNPELQLFFSDLRGLTDDQLFRLSKTPSSINLLLSNIDSDNDTNSNNSKEIANDNNSSTESSPASNNPLVTAETAPRKNTIRQTTTELITSSPF